MKKYLIMTIAGLLPFLFMVNAQAMWLYFQNLTDGSFVISTPQDGTWSMHTNLQSFAPVSPGKSSGIAFDATGYVAQTLLNGNSEVYSKPLILTATAQDGSGSVQVKITNIKIFKSTHGNLGPEGHYYGDISVSSNSFGACLVKNSDTVYTVVIQPAVEALIQSCPGVQSLTQTRISNH